MDLPYINKPYTKGRLKQLVTWSLESRGVAETVALVERLKHLGFAHATTAGISLGIEDLMIPERKRDLVDAATARLRDGARDVDRGATTPLQYSARVIDTWAGTNDAIKDELLASFKRSDTLNPVLMMAFSGARGNISQVRQLVGMRGLMSDPNGEIIDFVVRSNFREGLSLTEYIVACYGSRKGVVDTALKTATSGYLTRRLVDVAQHVVVASNDCGSPYGFPVSRLASPTGGVELLSLRARLLGRVLAHDVVTDDGEFRRNREIDRRDAIVLSRRPGSVPLRSPLTCFMKRSVCRRCYGWNLSVGSTVGLGETVGVMAAQSIGEPGTQLTMRTFHTGGVFSGGAARTILNPSNVVGSRVIFPEPAVGLCVKTPVGRSAYLTKAPSKLLILAEGATGSELALPAGTLLYAKQAQAIAPGEPLAEVAQGIDDRGSDAMRTVAAPYRGEISIPRLALARPRATVAAKMSEQHDRAYRDLNLRRSEEWSTPTLLKVWRKQVRRRGANVTVPYGGYFWVLRAERRTFPAGGTGLWPLLPGDGWASVGLRTLPTGVARDRPLLARIDRRDTPPPSQRRTTVAGMPYRVTRSRSYESSTPDRRRHRRGGTRRGGIHRARRRGTPMVTTVRDAPGVTPGRTTAGACDRIHSRRLPPGGWYRTQRRTKGVDAPLNNVLIARTGRSWGGFAARGGFGVQLRRTLWANEPSPGRTIDTLHPIVDVRASYDPVPEFKRWAKNAYLQGRYTYQLNRHVIRDYLADVAMEVNPFFPGLCDVVAHATGIGLALKGGSPLAGYPLVSLSPVSLVKPAPIAFEDGAFVEAGPGGPYFGATASLPMDAYITDGFSFGRWNDFRYGRTHRSVLAWFSPTAVPSSPGTTIRSGARSRGTRRELGRRGERTRDGVPTSGSLVVGRKDRRRDAPQATPKRGHVVGVATVRRDGDRVTPWAKSVYPPKCSPSTPREGSPNVMTRIPGIPPQRRSPLGYRRRGRRSLRRSTGVNRSVMVRSQQHRHDVGRWRRAVRDAVRGLRDARTTRRTAMSLAGCGTRPRSYGRGAVATTALSDVLRHRYERRTSPNDDRARGRGGLAHALGMVTHGSTWPRRPPTTTWPRPFAPRVAGWRRGPSVALRLRHASRRTLAWYVGDATLRESTHHSVRSLVTCLGICVRRHRNGPRLRRTAINAGDRASCNPTWVGQVMRESVSRPDDCTTRWPYLTTFGGYNNRTRYNPHPEGCGVVDGDLRGDLAVRRSTPGELDDGPPKGSRPVEDATGAPLRLRRASSGGVGTVVHRHDGHGAMDVRDRALRFWNQNRVSVSGWWGVATPQRSRWTTNRARTRVVGAPRSHPATFSRPTASLRRRLARLSTIDHVVPQPTPRYQPNLNPVWAHLRPITTPARTGASQPARTGAANVCKWAWRTVGVHREGAYTPSSPRMFERSRTREREEIHVGTPGWVDVTVTPHDGSGTTSRLPRSENPVPSPVPSRSRRSGRYSLRALSTTPTATTNRERDRDDHTRALTDGRGYTDGSAVRVSGELIATYPGTEEGHGSRSALTSWPVIDRTPNEVRYLTTDCLVHYRHSGGATYVVGDHVVANVPIGSPRYRVRVGGQILGLSTSRLTLRRGAHYRVPTHSHFDLRSGAFVERHHGLMTVRYRNLATADIVQGIPKVDRIFEARPTLQRLALGHLLSSTFDRFQDGVALHPGLRENILHRGLQGVQRFAINAVQNVYQSQGVNIADKHLEIILRQMTAKVVITYPGDSGLLFGDNVYLAWIRHLQLSQPRLQPGEPDHAAMVRVHHHYRPPLYTPAIRGITKTALDAQGFLAAASFQETARVLSHASVQGRRDFLGGLKGNVIMGSTLPMGTGMMSERMMGPTPTSVDPKLFSRPGPAAGIGASGAAHPRGSLRLERPPRSLRRPTPPTLSPPSGRSTSGSNGGPNPPPVVPGRRGSRAADVGSVNPRYAPHAPHAPRTYARLRRIASWLRSRRHRKPSPGVAPLAGWSLRRLYHHGRMYDKLRCVRLCNLYARILYNDFRSRRSREVRTHDTVRDGRGVRTGGSPRAPRVESGSGVPSYGRGHRGTTYRKRRYGKQARRR